MLIQIPVQHIKQEAQLRGRRRRRIWPLAHYAYTRINDKAYLVKSKLELILSYKLVFNINVTNFRGKKSRTTQGLLRPWITKQDNLLSTCKVAFECIFLFFLLLRNVPYYDMKEGAMGEKGIHIQQWCRQQCVWVKKQVKGRCINGDRRQLAM